MRAATAVRVPAHACIATAFRAPAAAHTHTLRAPALVQVPARSNLVTGVRVPARPPVRAYR
eukprot:7720768-Alexandrium_andersonii.AAC.1